MTRKPDDARVTTGKSRRPLTPDDLERFLAELREGMSISHAAAAIGRLAVVMYQRRETDEVFAAAWAAAVEAGTDLLEDEARRRAYQGVAEPVYQGKELVGHKQKYSDLLLLALLNARRPERFRQNHKVEHGGKIEVLSVDAIDAEIARLSAEMQARQETPS